MRLWYPEVLKDLPTPLLTALHRNVCRLRSTPTRKPTAQSWYYRLSWSTIIWYHSLVIGEMNRRSWKPSPKWSDPSYRGRKMKPIQGFLLNAPVRGAGDSFYNEVNESLKIQKEKINEWKSRRRGPSRQ